ncbi:MAG: hypothetical protein ACRD09_07600 [Vicinamibacterales bacterium]
MKLTALAAVLMLIAFGEVRLNPDQRPVEIESPAPAGSAQPHLADAYDGGVILSWLERSGTGHRFRFAIRRDGRWTEPVTIAEGDRFFANWADVPSVVRLPDGSIIAHWLQVSGPGKYAYDVMLRHSRDEGRTWSSPLIPHGDGTQTEHGFVSIVSWPGSTFGDRFGVVWLDGRDFAKHGGGHGEAGMKAEMSLRATVPSQMVGGSISGSGAASPPVSVWTLGEDMLVDSRVCECCPTAAARTSRGVIVAYRDRSPGEVRDIAVTRFEGGRWTDGKVVHADNWQIPGCPVNGPALAASGSRVALAWFAAPENNARVSVAFSNDAGVTFGAPIRVDDGLPLGRVALATLDDASALVGWLEYVKDPTGRGGSSAEFRMRRVSTGGARGDAMTVARVTSERASGYPRLARSGDVVTFAWVAGDRVKVASMTLR